MNRDIATLREAITKIVPMLAGKGLRVTQQGTNAYVETEPKTGRPLRINIPNLPDTASDELILAIQGFIDHEVAHVLFTDFSRMEEAYATSARCKVLWNIVEDTFIERAIAERFPGSRYNVQRLHEFFVANITEPALAKCTDDVQRFQVLLVPVARALAGQQVFIDYLAKHDHWSNPLIKAMMARLSPTTIDRMPRIAGSAESLEIARELHDILYPPEPPAPPPPPEPEPEPEDGDGDGEGESDGAGGASKPKPKDEDKDADDDDAGEDAGEPGDVSEDGSDAEEEDSDALDPEDADETGDDDADDADGDDADDDADDADDGAGAGSDVDDDDVDEDGGSAGSDSSDDPTDSDDTEGEDDGAADEDDGELDGDDTGGSEDDEVGDDDDAAGDGSDAEDEDGAGAAADGAADGTADELSDDGELSEAEGEIEMTPESSPFDELSLEVKDFDAEIATKIALDAVTDMNKADYRVFTRDWDIIEPREKGRGYQDKWLVRLDDSVRHMIGVMQKDIERMMAARSQVVQVPGYRSGRLHGGGLYRLMANDDRVFRRKHENKSKDTAVTLLVDNSGSMRGSKTEIAMASAYALATTLERVGISYEVLGFTTVSDPARMPKDYGERLSEEYARTRIAWSRTEPLYMPIYKGFDERLTPTTRARFANAMNDWSFLCQNIDGECVEIAAHRLLRRREARKVMIVLSDGQPAGATSHDGTLARHLKTVVQDITKMGIDIVGIGIKDESVKRFYPRHVVLNDLAALPGQVMSELKRILSA